VDYCFDPNVQLGSSPNPPPDCNRSDGTFGPIVSVVKIFSPTYAEVLADKLRFVKYNIAPNDLALAVHSMGL